MTSAPILLNSSRPFWHGNVSAGGRKKMPYRDWHPQDQQRWEAECMNFHGEILTGEFCHYCDEWDDLPIDETCEEFAACTCEYKDWDLKAAAMHREAMGDEIDRRMASAAVLGAPAGAGSDRPAPSPLPDSGPSGCTSDHSSEPDPEY